MELTKMTASALSDSIKKREISVKDALDAYFDSIKRQDGKINAYITLDKENAYKSAERIQKKIDKGECTSPLAGVPIAIKDNICTRGLKTTCASKMLADFVPTYEAEVVKKIRDADMIVIGKTNMDEFAMGSTTETSYFGPTANPVDTRRVPGGSSGGSCAAVAAKEAPIALGSDTGGSIRLPCSYCGIVGLKPTYGMVSRYGLIAHGSSLDQIGPIGKDVRDCAALMEIIAGKDAKDSTSVSLDDCDFLESLNGTIQGLRVGLPMDYFGSALQSDVKEAIYSAAALLKKSGATVEEFRLGMFDYAISAYYVIASAEASSNLERFDGVKYGFRASHYDGLQDMYKKTRSEGFGTEVKRRIMLGSFVLSSGYYDAYYLKALKTKSLINKAFDEAFSKYDVLLSPTAPTTAPAMGSSLSDPIKMYLSDIYTVSVNLAGLAAMSVPCGVDSLGLPIGMQIIGRRFSEKTILKTAYAYERLAMGQDV